VNYENSQNPQLLLAAGNRADVLVQAPKTPGQYVLLTQQVRSRCATVPLALIPNLPTTPPKPICAADDTTPVPLLSVSVTAGAPATGNQAQFIPASELKTVFPPFLRDITDAEVTGTKTVVFESVPTNGSPGVMHTIDGHKFDGNVGEVVMLNTVEEWKIVNSTVNGAVKNGSVVATDPPGIVDHPFHIHINPFQIVEFFDPNELLPGTSTYKYVFVKSATQPLPVLQSGQCLLFYDKPDTWKPCDSGPKTNLIWWDVFMIPSARAVFIDNNSQSVTVPGYFKMRSRFVDFAGQYVLHCHILAHEDRGMMTVVEVVPFTTAYSHQ
jgi:FtsP/CotA-like multicopper oxidase with cupredoxin domain